MRERPILFSAPMVRAILAGTKTQTRRIASKPVRHPDFGNLYTIGALMMGPEPKHVIERACPYGAPGARLWVRETWAPGDEMVFGAAKDDPETVLYRADKAALHWDGKAMRTPLNAYAFNWEAVGWKPSIHMPRWASRITLEVTEVRVERLQDISEADAIAEGCEAEHPDTAVGAYEWLWESINGPGSWDANPWVWVLSFRRIDGGRNG